MKKIATSRQVARGTLICETGLFWLIVDWTVQNNLQWKLNQSKTNYFQEKANLKMLPAKDSPFCSGPAGYGTYTYTYTSLLSARHYVHHGKCLVSPLLTNWTISMAFWSYCSLALTTDIHLQCEAIITVNFLINIHKRHPIARPLGMGCFLWIQYLIDILPQLL